MGIIRRYDFTGRSQDRCNGGLNGVTQEIIESGLAEQTAKSSYSSDRLTSLGTTESIGIGRKMVRCEGDDHRRGKWPIYMWGIGVPRALGIPLFQKLFTGPVGRPFRGQYYGDPALAPEQLSCS